jgi:hypothetical protein
MLTFLSSPGNQLIALLILSGLVICFSVFALAKAFRKLKTKSKSFTEIAEDGERAKERLERYAGKLTDE